MAKPGYYISLKRLFIYVFLTVLSGGSLLLFIALWELYRYSQTP